MNTPVNPTLYFYYIKVGCKGVYITRTCYHDDGKQSRHIEGENNTETATKTSNTENHTKSTALERSIT